MDKPKKVFALIGNPNSGKTTIFNGLTGGHHRIGNWPGVTVEKRQGRLKMAEPGIFLAQPFIGQGEVLDAGHTVRKNSQILEGDPDQAEIVDLPGLYSLSASTEDEKVARDYLIQESPDLIINVVDASNLERNLYLTMQLLELGHPMLVVLSMMDIAGNRGISIDIAALSKELGLPVLGIQGNKKSDIKTLTHMLRAHFAHPEAPRLPHYRKEVEDWLAEEAGPKGIAGELTHLVPRISGTEEGRRWALLQALENPQVLEDLSRGEPDPALRGAVKSLEDRLGLEADLVLAEDKYAWIEVVCKASSRKKAGKQGLTDAVDRLVMHRIWGIPIFLVVMYLVFWFTIGIGGAFIDFFDILAGALFVELPGGLLEGLSAPDWLISILCSGIGSGLQTVATFIPIIFSMFFMLSILEDSGYMARAAFVLDRFMRVLGLPGKAFIPMVVGFGCTVPGIMGTRTLESTKDRFTTIFMTPFMSCGARLPVYALFVHALFPQHSGLVVFSLYLVGILLAILTGLLLKFTVFRGQSSYFVMELPPYHAPRIGYSAKDSLRRLGSFVLRAGTAIVLAIAILSGLGSIRLGPPDAAGEPILNLAGKAVTPVLEPMGIEEENWPATVSLVTGIFAKEVIVASLSGLYALPSGEDLGAASAADDYVAASIGDLEQESDLPDLASSLSEALASIPDGLSTAFGGFFQSFSEIDEEIDQGRVLERLRNAFNPAQGYAYLLFILIYTPCAAAVGAAIREMGRARGLGLAFYLLGLAWAVSTLFYQIVEGGQLLSIMAALGMLGLIVLSFVILGRRDRGLRKELA